MMLSEPSKTQTYIVAMSYNYTILFKYNSSGIRVPALAPKNCPDPSTNITLYTTR